MFRSNWQRNTAMPNMTIHANIRLGPQGRVVVPARIRKALDFQPGDKLVAHIDNGQLVIEKAEAVERRLHVLFRKFEGRSLAGELIAERREGVRRESGS